MLRHTRRPRYSMSRNGVQEEQEMKKSRTEDDAAATNERNEKALHSNTKEKGSQGIRGNTLAENDRNESQKMETNDDVDKITESMSALNFVPSSIRFGRGRGKRGFMKR